MSQFCIPEKPKLDTDKSLRALVEERAVSDTLNDLCRDLRFMCLAMKSYNETVRFTWNDFNELNTMTYAFIDQIKSKENVLSVLRDFFEDKANYLSPEQIDEALRGWKSTQEPQVAQRMKDRRHV